MNRRDKFKNAVWGLHTDLHAKIDDTELCKDLTVEYLTEVLNKINPDFVQCDCKGHPGYTSYPTKVGTTCPGLMRDNLKIWREATAILNIPLLVHYSGIVDIAAVEQHPEWAVVGAEDQKRYRWDMSVTCLNSHYDEELMIPQMKEILKNYDVDGFWIDGENWGVLPCYCEKCRKQFRDEYGINEPPETENDKNWEIWLSMSHKNFERHVNKVCDAIHAVNEECLVCSNWAYTLRQPEKVNVNIDFISGDSWKLERINCEVRMIENQGKMWNLMPWVSTDASYLNTTDSLCQKSSAILSRGGAVLMYQDPIRTGVFNERDLCQLAQVEKFIRARQSYLFGSELVPQVAILHSKETYYSLNEPVYMTGDASLKSVQGAVTLSLASGYETTILTSDGFKENGNIFPVIIAPEQNELSGENTEILKNYAYNGATVIISGHKLCQKFEKVLGGRIEECQSIGFVEVNDMPFNTNGYSKFIPESAKTIKKLLPNHGVGIRAYDTPYAAISETRYGKGRIIAIFGDFFNKAQNSGIPAPRHILKEIIDGIEDERLVRISAPSYIQPSIRKKDGKIIVAFVNISADYPMFSNDEYCEKVPYAGPVAIEMKLVKEPVNVYNVPSMDPVGYTYRNGILKATIEKVHILDMLVIE